MAVLPQRRILCRDVSQIAPAIPPADRKNSDGAIRFPAFGTNRARGGLSPRFCLWSVTSCPGNARSIGPSLCRTGARPERSATPRATSGSSPNQSATRRNGGLQSGCLSMLPRIADQCYSRKWLCFERSTETSSARSIGRARIIIGAGGN